MKRSFQKQLCLFGSVFVAFSMIFTSFLISAFPVTESKAAPEPTSPVLNEQNAAIIHLFPLRVGKRQRNPGVFSSSAHPVPQQLGHPHCSQKP